MILKYMISNNWLKLKLKNVVIVGDINVNRVIEKLDKNLG